MNPWIDIFGWTLAFTCIIFLTYEVPRAGREIKSILADAREIQRYIRRGGDK